MSRIASVRIAATADGRLVLDTDPAAEFLVVGVGGVVPDEYDGQPLPGEAPEKARAEHTPKVEGEPAPKRTAKKG